MLFIRLTRISLYINDLELLGPTCPRASPRIMMVRVWLPAMPPILATMGISTASATTFSSVPSYRPMTQEARNAVARLMPSQTARRRALSIAGAKMSLSSSRPAMLINEWSASSRITSTTSSIVMRPNSLPSSSMTGADTRSRSSNRRATASSSMVAGMPSTSVSITSATLASGSLVSRVASGSSPW